MISVSDIDIPGTGKVFARVVFSWPQGDSRSHAVVVVFRNDRGHYNLGTPRALIVTDGLGVVHTDEMVAPPAAWAHAVLAAVAARIKDSE